MLIRNVESGKAPCPTVVGLDNGEIRDSVVAVTVVCRVVGACADVCAIVLERGLAQPGSARPGVMRRCSCRSRVLMMGLLSSWWLKPRGSWLDLWLLLERMMVWPRSPSLLVGLRRCSLGITPSRKPETCLILPVP